MATFSLFLFLLPYLPCLRCLFQIHVILDNSLINATQGSRTLAPAGTTAATGYIVRHPAHGPRRSAYALRPHSMHSMY